MWDMAKFAEDVGGMAMGAATWTAGGILFMPGILEKVSIDLEE
jgi:hypothetical protein